MQPHTLLHKKKLLNKSAMHAVISLLLQSRKFWWYVLLTSSMLLHDVMTWYCCQGYAKCQVTTSCSSRTAHRHSAPCTCNSWTVASRNAKLSCVQPVASKQPRSQSCGLRDLGCHAALCLPQTDRQIHTVDDLKVNGGWAMSIFYEVTYWPVARKTSSVCSR